MNPTTCLQCGKHTPNPRRKLCSAVCLRDFRIALARRTIATRSTKLHRCLFCGQELQGKDRKTCGPGCLRSFRAQLARRTLLTIHPCMNCGCKIYGTRQTCSDFCLTKVRIKIGEPARRKYRYAMMMQDINQKKLARDKALWEARHPIIIQ